MTAAPKVSDDGSATLNDLRRPTASPFELMVRRLSNTDWGGNGPPPDVLNQMRVHEAISAGHPLPAWGYPNLRPYNSYSGSDRIRGWQITRVAMQLDLLDWPRRCSVCEVRDKAIGLHSELYGRPLLSKAVCRSCHFHIHQRFERPGRWQQFLERHNVQGWPARIPLQELAAAQANALERLKDPLGLAECRS
jgi:hypothetical protein